MKITAIGSHFDDLEISCGGTLYSLAHQKGNKVTAIIASLSDYTKYDGTIIRTKECAREEGIKALNSLGIKNIYELGYPTKQVPHSNELTEKINAILDKEEADLIIIPHPSDSHSDHSNLAKSAIAACRYYYNILMTEPFYPSNLSFGKAFEPKLYTDISSTMPFKLKSVKCHKNEYKNHSHWERMILTKAEQRGIEIGVKYAECFEPLKYIWEI